MKRKQQVVIWLIGILMTVSTLSGCGFVQLIAPDFSYTYPSTEEPTAAVTQTVVVTPVPTVSGKATATPTRAPTPTSTPVLTPSPVIDFGASVAYAAPYCRTVLTQSQRNAYDTIVAGLSDPDAIRNSVIKVSVQYQATGDLVDEIALLAEAVIMDHPELYYLKNSYSYSYAGKRMTEFRIDTMSKEEALSLRESINEGIAYYKQQVSASMSQYEISKQFYELLATKLVYSEATGDRAHSIVGAFVDEQCVCEGFSKAYQLLLNLYGIRAFTVTGVADSGAGEPENHRWVAAEIENNWYFSDPTWADLKDTSDVNTYPKTGYIKVSYTYLNLTAAEMAMDHTLDDVSQSMTAGLSFTATTNNYFTVEEGYFAEFDSESVESYIKTRLSYAITNHRETFGLKMGSDAAYDSMLAYIRQNIYQLYLEIPEGNNQSVSFQIYIDQEHRTLHVWIC